MAEVLFYHLVQGSVEKVLPPLLEKSLERGWRVTIESPDEARLTSLDAYLWSYKDASFLPHGLSREKHASEQPILLASTSENHNQAQVRFLIDGAEPENVSDYLRLVLIFDGRDEAALASARLNWKRIKEKGHEVTYWQQNARGGWEKKA